MRSCPTTPEELRQLEQGLRNKWNISYAVSSIGGKHIDISKEILQSIAQVFFAIVLPAVVDVDNKVSLGG